ncbi:hypothetical protein AAGS40_21480 [Paraburkholderia sp. PREW-6R]|uniref:hypothetical protein n=1 Tax=Paraburkholderia sp. PREW-6R TaxID=3141544 RepID=UPI0031F5BE64
MKPKTPSPQHLSRDISQLGLALRDCARQIRYAARNVPGQVKPDRPPNARTPLAQRARPSGRLSLESVAHFADDLIETAETFAGHAMPPLQDHWKSPVPLESLTTYLFPPEGASRNTRIFATGYYAAAKRMIMQCGATDVLIFEHLISRAFEEVESALAAPGAARSSGVGADSSQWRHALCQACARLVLALIDAQPIRSTRFDALPDASAPWWLITEPNAYVFLTLSVAALARNIFTSGMVTEPDAAVRFFADVIGAREEALRRALKDRDALRALTAEIEHVVSHLC